MPAADCGELHESASLLALPRCANGTPADIRYIMVSSALDSPHFAISMLNSRRSPDSAYRPSEKSTTLRVVTWSLELGTWSFRLLPRGVRQCEGVRHRGFPVHDAQLVLHRL